METPILFTPTTNHDAPFVDVDVDSEPMLDSCESGDDSYSYNAPGDSEDHGPNAVVH